MGFISYNTVCHIFFCTLYGQFIITGWVVKTIILFFFNQLANKTIYSKPLVFKYTTLIQSGRKLKLHKFKYTSAYCFKMNLILLPEMSPKNQVLWNLILCQSVSISPNILYCPHLQGPTTEEDYNIWNVRNYSPNDTASHPEELTLQ